ncbi:MAG: serine/threonine protein kinase [Gemmataceae bacterium]|nr:serine/threonine protein kinase [Gemmataceae bacterium]
MDAKIVTKGQADRLRLDDTPVAIDFSDLAEETPHTSHPTKVAPAVPGDPTQMGPYRILRRLGEGGMGAVYLAFDSKDNRQVALKVLSSEQAPKQNILHRFQREARNGALLVHPNIVRTWDTGQEQASGLHYIVLEYVDGPTAHDLLDRAGKLPIGDALHIILDIARALEHAHKNQIIHRDIKPANILVTASGLAKLSDLGLVKRRDDPGNLTHASQGIGTPYYMPYEQAMNAKMADERSDIYAFGATLYHLITGEVPFPGVTSLEIVEKKGAGYFVPASEHNPEIPARLEEILARMLARDPDDRYQTISEVIVDLERSQLAAVIPSFVRIDSALADPVVVERLTSPVEATQPDLQVKRALEEKQTKEKELWFLRYRDQRGNLCKSKGTAAEILERVRKGTIPVNAEAARFKPGKFKPLDAWPEFEPALTALPARMNDEERRKPSTSLSQTRQRAALAWWLATAASLGLGIVAAGAMAVYLLVF